MTASSAAARILDAWDRGAALDRATLPLPDTLAGAEALQHAVVALRRARGERPLGYKIGFTNRTIWPVYGVDRPIWGPVWDRTVTLLDGTSAVVDAAAFAEPRLEPEIVFGLDGVPTSADPEAVWARVAWVAHGFEIVQSPFPAWRFSAAEAVAAQSLHGALLVGPRKPRSAFPEKQVLTAFELALACDGRPAARGRASDVLGGPLHALCHLVAELARRDAAFVPDAIVTTGTITDAQPLSAGQAWVSQPIGIDLPGLALRIR